MKFSTYVSASPQIPSAIPPQVNAPISATGSSGPNPSVKQKAPASKAASPHA